MTISKKPAKKTASKKTAAKKSTSKNTTSKKTAPSEETLGELLKMIPTMTAEDLGAVFPRASGDARVEKAVRAWLIKYKNKEIEQLQTRGLLLDLAQVPLDMLWKHLKI